MADRHDHCGWCGARFETATWPRVCPACEHITYRNPTPVAVVVQPVDQGLLVVQRAIEPGAGRWALPGGFIDHGESWQAAAARELAEETGLETDPTTLELFAAHSTPSGAELILFALATPIRGDEMPRFTPRDEVRGVDVLRAPIDLAFPLHTQVCAAFFSRAGG